MTKRLASGDKLRDISARELSDALAAGADYRRHGPPSAAETPRTDALPPSQAYARNDTEQDLDVWDAAAVGPPAILPTDNSPEFQFRPTLTLVTAPQVPHALAICVEPIRAGAIGRVQLSGTVPARLYGGVGRFARLPSGLTGQLCAVHHGTAAILWREEQGSWALVLLAANAPSTHMVRLTSDVTASSGATPGVGTGIIQRLYGGELVDTAEPELTLYNYGPAISMGDGNARGLTVCDPWGQWWVRRIDDDGTMLSASCAGQAGWSASAGAADLRHLVIDKQSSLRVLAPTEGGGATGIAMLSLAPGPANSIFWSGGQWGVPLWHRSPIIGQSLQVGDVSNDGHLRLGASPGSIVLMPPIDGDGGVWRLPRLFPPGVGQFAEAGIGSHLYVEDTGGSDPVACLKLGWAPPGVTGCLIVYGYCCTPGYQGEGAIELHLTHGRIERAVGLASCLTSDYQSSGFACNPQTVPPYDPCA